MEKQEIVTKPMYAKQRFTVRQMATVGLLSAITVVLGMTGLGFIPIPPINATILHIPTLIGALLEGPRIGAASTFWIRRVTRTSRKTRTAP